jgi:hypothetical protein
MIKGEYSHLAPGATNATKKKPPHSHGCKDRAMPPLSSPPPTIPPLLVEV